MESVWLNDRPAGELEGDEGNRDKGNGGGEGERDCEGI